MIWRTAESPWYRLIFVVVLLVQLVVLGILASAFILYSLDAAFAHVVHTTLIVAVMATFVSLVLLILFGFMIQLTSRRRQQSYQQQVDEWLNKWLDVTLFEVAQPLPAVPLSAPAIEALVRLRDVMGGADLTALHRLFEHYDLHTGWLKQLQSGSPMLRLAALEALARLGLANTLPAIQAQMRHTSPLVRSAAAKTAAFILSDATTPSTCIHAFIETFITTPLSSTMQEETLVLTGSRAEELLRYMLHHPDLSEAQRVAVINVAGWLHLQRLAPYIALYLDDVTPTIRAACLRVLAQMNMLPGDSHYAIQNGVADPNEVVRLQAVRALAVLPLYRSYGMFWRALHDESWWVRLAAAETLWQKGPAGYKMLQEIASQKAQQQSGQMAQYILANAGDIHADVWIWSRG